MGATLEQRFAIVVIGRNEGERLRAACARSSSVSPNLVYADSASSDGSVELARSMGAFVVEVDPSLPLNAARGRNAGLAVVREQFPDCGFVQFLDGDCLLAPGWVEIRTRVPGFESARGRRLRTAVRSASAGLLLQSPRRRGMEHARSAGRRLAAATL